MTDAELAMHRFDARRAVDIRPGDLVYVDVFMSTPPDYLDTAVGVYAHVTSANLEDSSLVRLTVEVHVRLTQQMRVQSFELFRQTGEPVLVVR